MPKNVKSALALPDVRPDLLTSGDAMLCALLAQDPLNASALQQLRARVEHIGPDADPVAAAGLVALVNHFAVQAEAARRAVDRGWQEAAGYMTGDARRARLDILEKLAKSGALSDGGLQLGNDLAARLLAGPGAKAAPAIDYAAIRVDGGKDPGDSLGPKGWDGEDAKIWREGVQPWQAEMARRPLWALASEEGEALWADGVRTRKGQACKVLALDPVTRLLTGHPIKATAARAGVDADTLKNAIPASIALYGNILHAAGKNPLDLTRQTKA